MEVIKLVNKLFDIREKGSKTLIVEKVYVILSWFIIIYQFFEDVLILNTHYFMGESKEEFWFFIQRDFVLQKF